jgi:hypothetical protein
MYFQWEKVVELKVKILRDFIANFEIHKMNGMKSEEVSLALLNSFIQILKWDVNGPQYIQVLFQMDNDAISDIEDDILKIILPKHRCILLLVFACFTMLGYLPGFLFYNYPFNYLVYKDPFLMRWDNEASELNANHACAILYFGFRYFVTAGYPKFASILLRNEIEIRRSILKESNAQLMEILQRIPKSLQFQLTEQMLKCLVEETMDPSSIFFMDKNNSWTSLIIATKKYIDREEFTTGLKFLYCGICMKILQIPKNMESIQADDDVYPLIMEILTSKIQNHIAMKVDNNNFWSWYLYLFVMARDSPIDAIPKIKNCISCCETPKHKLLFQRLYLKVYLDCCKFNY